jgi:hypothetical protein
VSLDEVMCSKTPDKTETWVPIPHGQVVSLVKSNLEGLGQEIASEEYGLQRDGQRFFGVLKLKPISSIADYTMAVGIRNSHDKSFPAGALLGSDVFVCDNLAFSGEIKFSRKHTIYIERDLPSLVSAAIGRLIEARGRQDERIAQYKQTELSVIESHDLFVRALDARVVPVTLLPDVIKEYRNPRHPEFQDRTLWSFFNAFTEIIKGNLHELPRRTQALHGMADQFAGLLGPVVKGEGAIQNVN